jgi:hypothetical protein
MNQLIKLFVGLCLVLTGYGAIITGDNALVIAGLVLAGIAVWSSKPEIQTVEKLVEVHPKTKKQKSEPAALTFMDGVYAVTQAQRTEGAALGWLNNNRFVQSPMLGRRMNGQIVPRYVVTEDGLIPFDLQPEQDTQPREEAPQHEYDYPR